MANSDSLKTRRPSVFVGSSSEGQAVAEAVQVNLDAACDVVIWSQGVFGLGEGTLESLVERLDEFDFAVLVLSADDLSLSRGEVKQSPRDNVLLELGLCIGGLGRTRTFIVYDKTSDIKLPSDLAGVTTAPYQPHASGNLQASLGAPCTRIKTAIKEAGLKPRAQFDFSIDQNTQFQIIADLLDLATRQFFILMHLENAGLRRGSLWEGGTLYEYAKPNSSCGSGGLDVRELCSKLADAGLLTIDLRMNVSLSARGHQFACWLLERGHKVEYFWSSIGGWGERPTEHFFARNLRPDQLPKDQPTHPAPNGLQPVGPPTVVLRQPLPPAVP